MWSTTLLLFQLTPQKSLRIYFEMRNASTVAALERHEEDELGRFWEGFAQIRGKGKGGTIAGFNHSRLSGRMVMLIIIFNF
jgi:hypothetical protein